MPDEELMDSPSFSSSCFRSRSSRSNGRKAFPSCKLARPCPARCAIRSCSAFLTSRPSPEAPRPTGVHRLDNVAPQFNLPQDVFSVACQRPPSRCQRGGETKLLQRLDPACQLHLMPAVAIAIEPKIDRSVVVLQLRKACIQARPPLSRDFAVARYLNVPFAAHPQFERCALLGPKPQSVTYIFAVHDQIGTPIRPPPDKDSR